MSPLSSVAAEALTPNTWARTDQPLAGNQLAVFTDAREIPDEQLQPLAKEMNFPESVFVYPAEQGGHVKIRIFTCPPCSGG